MQPKQFLVFSEYTDPAHHVQLVAQRASQHSGPLYFITKEQQLNVSLEYCAPLPQITNYIDPRISKTGCACDIEYRRLGFKPVPPHRKQREHCRCWAKTDGLPEFKSCKHNCVYCYFSKP